jgi:hypothetical protein
MKLTTAPAPPSDIADDFCAVFKFNEIASAMIAADKLNTGNLLGVEIAASAYSRWQDAELVATDEGFDSPAVTHAHRYRSSYLAALNALGLIRTPAAAKAAPKIKKPAPIKVVSDAPAEEPKSPRPRLTIYGRA